MAVCSRLTLQFCHSIVRQRPWQSAPIAAATAAVNDRDVSYSIQQAYAICYIQHTVLFNPETSILLQKRHPTVEI